MIRKTIDAGLRREYSRLVADKEATEFDSSIKKADTRQQAVFFCPSHAVPSMGGSGGEASACRVPSYRSVNPAICRPPRLTARSGSTLKKEAHMPGTVTSINPHFNRIDRAPYEFGELIRQLPYCLSALPNSSTETRQMADAAARHADNANATLMDGLEALGKLLQIAGSNKDGQVDGQDLASIGGLITHIAVEAQFLQQTKSDLRFALREHSRKVAGDRT